MFILTRRARIGGHLLLVSQGRGGSDGKHGSFATAMVAMARSWMGARHLLLPMLLLLPPLFSQLTAPVSHEISGGDSN